jgi:quinol-cytochrome oxidoreductase complex cytochrome b subunit
VDHHERHHEHHQKEREHEKKEHKAHEAGGKTRPFHPAWYIVVGVVLCLVALLVWMFVIRA